MRRTEPASAARRARGQESRERLLDAAARGVAERGFAATSVSDLCARAGVARTALYWHFGSKEGLLAAAIERVGSSWIERVREDVFRHGRTLERLDALIAGWRRIAEESPEWLRLLMLVLLEKGRSSPAVREAVVGVVARAREALALGLAEGLGAALSPEAREEVATTALALLQATVMARALDPEADLDRVFGLLRRSLVAVLRDRLGEDQAGALELVPALRDADVPPRGASW